MSPGPVPVSRAPSRAGRPSCRGCWWCLRPVVEPAVVGAGSDGGRCDGSLGVDRRLLGRRDGRVRHADRLRVGSRRSGCRRGSGRYRDCDRCRGCTHGAVGDGRGLLDRRRGDVGRGRRRSVDRGRTRRGCRRSRRNDALSGHRAGQDCSCRAGDVLACGCDRSSCSLCRRRGGRGGSRCNRGCDGRRDRSRDDSGEQCGECLRDARGRRVLPTLLLIGRRWLRARRGRGYFNGCGIDDCSPPLVVSWSCLRRPGVRRRTARRSRGRRGSRSSRRPRCGAPG